MAVPSDAPIAVHVAAVMESVLTSTRSLRSTEQEQTRDTEADTQRNRRRELFARDRATEEDRAPERECTGRAEREIEAPRPR